MNEAYQNILVISGDGRKCGKTTLACMLIKNHRSLLPYAVKICPHFHNTGNMEAVCVSEGLYGIYRETDTSSQKDSSLMLTSGAAEVFYIQCRDEGLKEAWEKLEVLLPNDRPVIVESGGLGRIINPGLHIKIIGSPQHKTIDTKTGVIIRTEDISGSFNMFRFIGNRWSYNS